MCVCGCVQVCVYCTYAHAGDGTRCVFCPSYEKAVANDPAHSRTEHTAPHIQCTLKPRAQPSHTPYWFACCRARRVSSCFSRPQCCGLTVRFSYTNQNTHTNTAHRAYTRNHAHSLALWPFVKRRRVRHSARACGDGGASTHIVHTAHLDQTFWPQFSGRTETRPPGHTICLHHTQWIFGG